MILVTLSIVLATTYHDLKQYQHKINQQIKQLQSSDTSKINSQKQQIDVLKTQLQSKAATAPVAVAVAVNTAPAVETAYTAPTQPPDTYKAQVYDYESGNNPAAVNPSSGACGLGQALPCSKLGCMLGDFACQDTWFTQYMVARYGSWEAAWNHELAFGWW